MFVCALAAGCMTNPGTKKPSGSTHQLLGAVTLVNEEQQFVLIDAGNAVVPLPGQALKSFTGEQESGVLVVSPERRAPFITADIVRGSPLKGDRVFE